MCKLMLSFVNTSFMTLYQDLCIIYLQFVDIIYTNSTSQTLIWAPSVQTASSHRLRCWHFPEIVIKWFIHLKHLMCVLLCFLYIFPFFLYLVTDTIHPRCLLSSLWVIYRLRFFIFSVDLLFLFQWFSNLSSSYIFLFLFTICNRCNRNSFLLWNII